MRTASNFTQLLMLFFVASLGNVTLAQQQPNSNSGMITIRVGPNGETSFVYGDGVPNSNPQAGQLNWQDVNEGSSAFGDLQFNSYARPGGHRPPPPPRYQQPYYPNYPIYPNQGYWGGGYYPYYYPPFYPNYPTYYICGAYGIWPFVYYRYCW